MASSRLTPVSRESPAVSRHEGETAASSSATRDEIPRSHNGNAKLSENGAFLFLAHGSLGSLSGASRDRRLLSRDPALITCCSAERGGGRERLLRKTPIYHDSPALGMTGLAISSATVLLPHVISLLVVRWLT
jgi:hypothetical protein